MPQSVAHRPTEYDAYPVFAGLYDSVHAGVTDDIAFYVEEARQAAAPVLEVGCGTGRVLLAVAAAGVPIMGIDVSPTMLALCHQKVAALDPELRARVRIVEANMVDFALPERFDLIMIPNQGFLSLLNVEQQVRALRTLRTHLRDGGRLALDFFDPPLRTIGEGMNQLRGVFRIGRVGNATGDQITRLDNGNTIVHWFKSDWDPPSQLVDHTIVIEELDVTGAVIKRNYVHHTLRWLYRYECEHLLARCGFEVEAVYGAADRSPHLHMGQHLFWIARKAS